MGDSIMGHSHTHAGEQNAYYLDQLCTIGFCGALGVVQILLWNYGVLNMILDPKFHMPVLLSGIVLATLAAVRGISLWIAVGQAKAHAHDHACDHDHDHDHGVEHVHEHALAADHVHSHEHGHEHGVLIEEHSDTH